jgi:hypothetical protein
MTNHLFEEAGTGFGMDLVSLDTQRSRDHGTVVASLIVTFEYCSSLYCSLQV